MGSDGHLQAVGGLIWTDPDHDIKVNIVLLGFSRERNQQDGNFLLDGFRNVGKHSHTNVFLPGYSV